MKNKITQASIRELNAIATEENHILFGGYYKNLELSTTRDWLVNLETGITIRKN